MKTIEKCFHCGQDIEKERITIQEKVFCCQGCKSVFEILNANDLTGFYDLNKGAGVRPNNETNDQFNYLDTKEIFDKVVDFSEGETSLVTFKIPVIHCSSCIWLLESLQEFKPEIKYSQVNFTKKTVQVSFNHNKLPLSELAKFLTQLGYKPVINLETSEKKEEIVDRSLLLKLAVAGFAFGNAMMFALPEYLGTGDYWLEEFSPFFRFLTFLLSIPVVLYSASDYYKSAWFGLKNGIVNIDVPIVLGIFVLFFRSVYEIVTNFGPGYFDTLCGLLFFMLLGKYFQKRTYSALSYDRDYKSFYPIAVTKVDFGGEQTNILLSEIKVGDRILVRNQELIPVDAILINGEGNIDNSFITGEAASIPKKPGDKIFAGGKQSGTMLELEVIKTVNQSYLTQLWNKEAFRKQEHTLDSLVNKISKYFTFVILLITLFAGIYWYQIDFEKMFQVASAILIVACPCALALSTPFTMGHMMRIFGRNRFYVKDSHTIEKLSRIDTLVFDKTGTITQNRKSTISFEGETIADFDLENIKTLLKNSNHPLSKTLYDHIHIPDNHYPVENFEEVPGKGYSGKVRGNEYRIGSASFNGRQAQNLETAVYISRNTELLGKYVFQNQYRHGIAEMFKDLKGYEIHILSGDNSSEEETLRAFGHNIKALKFNQSPEDKLEYIKALQDQGKSTAMIGDGLNDAGALKQSNVGIAIAEDSNSFTPSSDIIMNGEVLPRLYNYLKMGKEAMTIIKITFIISLLYNVIGLSIAVMGLMSPLVAAILMPVSSITVVAFTSASTWYRSLAYFGWRR